MVWQRHRWNSFSRHKYFGTGIFAFRFRDNYALYLLPKTIHFLPYGIKSAVIICTAVFADLQVTVHHRHRGIFRYRYIAHH